MCSVLFVSADDMLGRSHDMPGLPYFPVHVRMKVQAALVHHVTTCASPPSRQGTVALG